MPDTPKPITLRELAQMLRDDSVTERSIRPYLAPDPETSRPFAPSIRPHPDLVKDEGHEGDWTVAMFNAFSKRKRRRIYRRKVAAQFDAIRIVSEGDSWFQYPLLLDDVVDHLMKEEDFAVFSLGGAGHRLADMLAEDEITDTLDRERPAFFLISGGGNDMVGDGRLATLIQRFEEGRPANEYPNAKFGSFLDEIRQLYRNLFHRLERAFPRMSVFCHGYDWAIPQRDKWLGAPLESIGITSDRLQAEIVHVLIDRLNALLSDLSKEFRNVRYINCRGVCGQNDWYDELHPTAEGFGRVAQKFAEEIRRAQADVEAVGSPVQCPGRGAFLTTDPALSESDFVDLVHRRARHLGVDDKDDPTVTEFNIKRFYEKVHLGADFLPARFLRDGDGRARAVCRIRTVDGASGTGFLVSNTNSIMTNNHVLPTAEVAAESTAEFGYESGGQKTYVALRPDTFFITNSKLDYTIVACDRDVVADVVAIPLLRSPSTITRGERVNVIQHPRGRPKEVAIRSNDVTSVLKTVVRYRADTEPGSSGSPVFNDTWDLVALHHAGFADGGGRATNEGIRIASIVADLQARMRRGEVSRQLSEIIASVADSSPHRGFFDLDGIVDADASREVEIPEFRGHADFADVMFWNIEHFNEEVGRDRVERVAGVLNRFAMDVMGLMEVQEGALERLVEALRERGSEMDFRVLDVRGRQDLAVLFDTETAKVTLRTDLNERHRDALMVRTRSGQTAFPREPLFAECTVDDNDLSIKFIMVVLHFKAFGDVESRARRRLAATSLREIVEDIRANLKLPIVIGGDFNETLNTDVLGALRDSPDLFVLTADDARSGAISYVGDSHRSLIDHIVTSRDVRVAPISGDDAAIVRLDRTMSDFTEAISDHVPLAMRLVARGRPLESDRG